MESIVATRDSISERFPVASFTVNVPERRLFEVVCATDPRLLHTDNASLRTPNNFYSSRSVGLMAAQRGPNAFVLPAEQLRRFAGARRIYYALGTYAGRQGEHPRFTIAPDTLDRVPSVALSSDFTGRSLDQRRLGVSSPSSNYGRQDRTMLRWGGDAVLEAERATIRRTASPAPANRSSAVAYDDGFDPSLWTRNQASTSTSHRGATSPTRYAGAPGVVYEDAAALVADRRPQPDPSEHYGGGLLEDGAQARQRGIGSAIERPQVAHSSSEIEHAYGRRGDSPRVEARLIEDGAQSRALGLARRVELEDRRSHASAGYGGAVAQVGYEDAATLRAHASALVRPVSDLRGRSREHRSGYGRRAPANSSDDASSAADYQGRHSAYREHVVEESLPIGPASTPLGESPSIDPVRPASPEPVVQAPAGTTASSRRPLTIADKVRILRVVAKADSGEDGYAAAYADPEFGLCWGLLAFTQRSGALGRVLALAKAREQAMHEDHALPDEQRFERLFGEHWNALLEQTDELRTPDPERRMQPVGGARLWVDPWLGRFRAAGKVTYVQAAQNQHAVEIYVDSILPIARALDCKSTRGLALLIDRVVHMGVGAGEAWIMDNAGLITSEAQRDQALAALGFAGDLAGFAHSRQLAPGWTPLVHAALCSALRGRERSPISLPSGEQAQQRLIAAARGSEFESRVRALLESRDLDDASLFDLG